MNYSQKFDGAVKFAQVDATTINAETVNAEQVIPANARIDNGVVLAWLGTDKKIVIPDYIDETPTTRIEELQNLAIVEVILPSTLTHIDTGAVQTSMTEIDLPASIEQIGANAFSSCTALTKVVCRATSVPVTGANAFPTGLTIQVPQSALSAYQSAWGSYGTVEAIPFDGVAELAKQATNVTTNINGQPISNIFESNGTTVKNATNAASATNANNVTTNINGQPISNIFESDGVTAKKCSLYLHQIQAKYTTLNIIAYFSIINNDNTPFTLNTFLSYLKNKSIQTISASGIVASGSGSELSIVLAEKVNLSGSNITISATFITNSGTSSWTVSTEELTVGALTDAVSTAL